MTGLGINPWGNTKRISYKRQSDNNGEICALCGKGYAAYSPLPLESLPLDV